MARNVAVAILLLAAVLASPALGAAPADPSARLAASIAREVQRRLTGIVSVAQAAARETPSPGAEPDEIRAFLTDRARYVPHVLHVALLTDKGVVRAIGPGYRFLEGTDLSAREWVKSALKGRKVTVSRTFLSLEGFDAVAVLAPVVRSGKVVGLVSVLFRPSALLGEWVEAERKGQPFDVWAMEPGGRLLYDLDREEEGKNLLADPMYAPHPELGKVARAIAASSQGSTRYRLTPASGEAMELAAVWRTVSAPGASWRVVVVRETREGKPPFRTLASLGVPSAIEALRQLAGDASFVGSVREEAWPTVQVALARYYERYPCYAVQWMTPKGYVMGGYPPGNALVSYQLDPFANPADTFLLERVQAAQEGIFRTPLAEKLMGTVQVVPVRSGEELLGFVYAVRVD